MNRALDREPLQTQRKTKTQRFIAWLTQTNARTARLHYDPDTATDQPVNREYADVDSSLIQ